MNIMAKRSKVLVVNRDWCKGCNICVAFCPKNVLELDSDEKVVVARLEACTYCGLCELRCPDFAITMQDAGAPIASSAQQESRQESSEL
jgi:2-oxoglutarate ferredoxin oxidoreductase subunit delta